MTRRPRPRMIAATLATTAAVALVGPAAGSEEITVRPHDDNVAVAVNQQDGTTVADTSVRVRFDRDGVIDQQNRAIAEANCVDCTTFAAAMQIVVVTSPPTVVTPLNQARSLNVACESCTTYASASQVVVGTNGPARLTARGHFRLAVLRLRLERLESLAGRLTAGELVTAVEAAEKELLTIADEDIVPIGVPDGAPNPTPPTIVQPLQRAAVES